MSLDWDISKIDDYKSTCYTEGEDGKDYLSPVTEALIFATIPVKLGSITEKNWLEFYARLNFCERMDGPYLLDKDGPRTIKADEVKAHIGLKCNVSNETQGNFLKGFSHTLDRIQRSVNA